MKIYTKRGDKGETDLFGGERVLKNHIQVKAYGDIDCANTAIGLAVSARGMREELKDQLLSIMKLLFCAGAEVATAPKEDARKLLERTLKNRIVEEHILELEAAIDDMESRLSPLKNFILPTGIEAAAQLHFARTMVRKAEISLMDLANDGGIVRPEILKFFNRLSDYLFVSARYLNNLAGIQDIGWDGSL